MKAITVLCSMPNNCVRSSKAFVDRHCLKSSPQLSAQARGAERFWRCDAAISTRSQRRCVSNERSKKPKSTAWESKNERGKRTITIDDDLVALLLKQREKLQRIQAGVPDGAAVDLSLVKLPDAALLFPAMTREALLFTKPRRPRNVTKEFDRKANALGFNCRFHDLRGSHETALLDAGVPVHVVAARCGHDPAVLLRSYAKRTKKADEGAAAVIGKLFGGSI
jgi:integrase